MKSPSCSGCIFCSIARRDISARIILENASALALLDVFPIRAGHALVITKKHYEKLEEIEQRDRDSLFQLVTKVSDALERGMNINATLIAIHNGRDAGQEVPHVHIHVVPRTSGDGGAPIHSIFKSRVNLDQQEMDNILNKLKEKIQN
jgi:histidine triad (HIT) family protein